MPMYACWVNFELPFDPSAISRLQVNHAFYVVPNAPDVATAALEVANYVYAENPRAVPDVISVIDVTAITDVAINVPAPQITTQVVPPPTGP